MRPSGFQLGLTTRKAIDKSAPRSVPNTFYLLEKTAACDDCRKCVEVCPTEAIDLRAPSRRAASSTSGPIILALGFQPFNPRPDARAGLRPHPQRDHLDAVRAAGLALRPDRGHRPAHLRRAASRERIAWLQCVGSRDQRNPYCSSICCMYATKEAMLAKQRNPGRGVPHLHHGRARLQQGIQPVLPAGARRIRHPLHPLPDLGPVDEDPATGEVILRYPGGREHGRVGRRAGAACRRSASTWSCWRSASGRRPRRSQIARTLGIELNEYGFCETDKFSPLATSRPGVFVCGAFASPKEIAETILDASGRRGRGHAPDARSARASGRSPAASRSSAAGLPRPTTRPAAERRSVAVALCGCAGEIAGRRRPAGRRRASPPALPGVAAVEVLPLACLPEGASRLHADLLRQTGANRLVVGGCSHRTHEPLFQRLVRRGRHESRTCWRLVNLREQCAWVHAARPGRRDAQGL